MKVKKHEIASADVRQHRQQKPSKVCRYLLLALSTMEVSTDQTPLLYRSLIIINREE